MTACKEILCIENKVVKQKYTVYQSKITKICFSELLTDIDECKTRCTGAHMDCQNTNGGYNCSCAAGYKLRADESACESEY